MDDSPAVLPDTKWTTERQCYIMAAASQTAIITILVMFFSSTVFGVKIASLGNYKETRERRDKAEVAPC